MHNRRLFIVTKDMATAAPSVPDPGSRQMLLGIFDVHTRLRAALPTLPH
jgi:hypothetical protein